MASKMYANTLMPAQPWELATAGSLGLTMSQLRFTLSFFLSVAAGIVLRYLPTPNSRHLFSALSGILLLYYPFGHGMIHAVVTSGLTYLFMLRFRQHCGTLTWLVIFPYLVLCHVLSASGMSWKEGHIDFTGAQMVANLKLIAVAMCYQDGLKAQRTQQAQHGQQRQQQGQHGGAGEVLGEAPATGDHKHREGGATEGGKQGGAGDGAGVPLRGYSQAKALASLPSPLEFVSYVFAAGNLLAGPFFEARDYLDYVQRKGDWDERDPKKRIPSPLLPGLLRLGKGVVFMGLWSYLVPAYNSDLMESAWWQRIPVWKRMCMMWVVGLVARFKYYFAWAVAESSLIFSGLCFDGYQETEGGKPNPRWTRYINSRIRRVEFCTSMASLAANWNVCTGIWLRYYVYERVTPPGKRPTFRSMVVTQTVSGIWHGLFPGYWLFFLSTAVMMESSKVIYRYEQGWSPRLRHFPLWVAAKMVYSAYILNYCASAFQILSFRGSIEAWRSVYFSGHVLMLAVMVVGAALPPHKARVKPQRASEALHAAAGAAAAAGERRAQVEAAAAAAPEGSAAAGLKTE